MFQHQDLFEHSKASGFTLVETLVALAILTVGLIPILWTSTTSVNLTASISNSLTAAHLAQEGIEVVRAMRDTNWFTAQPFTSLSQTCTAGGCRVQYDSAAPIPGGLTTKLRIDGTSGLYQYATGPDSLFTRTILIEANGPATRLTVRSTVAWTEKGVAKQFMVESFLFDWLP